MCQDSTWYSVGFTCETSPPRRFCYYHHRHGGEQLRMEGRKAQESQAEICECGLYHGGLEGSTGF